LCGIRVDYNENVDYNEMCRLEGSRQVAIIWGFFGEKNFSGKQLV
jgi:hypothetical protein